MIWCIGLDDPHYHYELSRTKVINKSKIETRKNKIKIKKINQKKNKGHSGGVCLAF
jgi:hypothetical protein